MSISPFTKTTTLESTASRSDWFNIATQLAWKLTGNPRYAAMHARVHDWAFAHFPDREHGEWFGYVHRDGSVSQRAKGNMFKGPFHLPRMLAYCWNECAAA